MEHSETKPRPKLIGNRFSAIIAVCLTALFAAEDVQAIFSNALPKSHWLIDLDFLSPPIWATALVNLTFYVFFLWAGVGLYRSTQGKERVLVCGWFASFLLGLLFGPIEGLIPPWAIATIRYAKGIGMSVAFIAALLILVKSPPFGKSDATSLGRLLLFLGLFVIGALVIGALIYFLPLR